MSLLRRLKCNSGLSIVELLIALAISMVLMAGIYQVFLGSTDTYQVSEQLARMQENGRFAIGTLRNEIRGAGYLGCSQDAASLVNTLNPGTAAQSFLANLNQAIYGYEANGTNIWADSVGTVNKTTLEADTLITDPLTGNDVLILRGINPDITLELTASMPNTSADLKMSSGLDTVLNTAGGDILLVSDCVGAAVFQTTSYTDSNGNTVHNTGGTISPGNATKDLGHPFESGAQVFFPQTTVYYIRNNTVGVPALFREVNNTGSVELIDGVENMQIRYGLDTNNDRNVDSYATANAISAGNWANVMSVRIGLLLRTVSEIPNNPLDTAQFNVDGDIATGTGGLEYDPVDDRRMRLVISGTMGLRNRLR